MEELKIENVLNNKEELTILYNEAKSAYNIYIEKSNQYSQKVERGREVENILNKMLARNYIIKTRFEKENRDKILYLFTIYESLSNDYEDAKQAILDVKQYIKTGLSFTLNNESIKPLIDEIYRVIISMLTIIPNRDKKIFKFGDIGYIIKKYDYFLKGKITEVREDTSYFDPKGTATIFNNQLFIGYQNGQIKNFTLKTVINNINSPVYILDVNDTKTAVVDYVDSNNIKILETNKILSHAARLMKIQFIGEDKLISLSIDGNLKIWNIITGDLLFNNLNTIVFSLLRNNRLAICFRGFNRILIVNLDKVFNLLTTIAPKLKSSYISTIIKTGLAKEIRFRNDPDNLVNNIIELLDGRIALSTDHGMIEIWNNGNKDFEFSVSTTPIYPMICIPNGNIMTAHSDHYVKIWDLTGNLVYQVKLYGRCMYMGLLNEKIVVVTSRTVYFLE